MRKKVTTKEQLLKELKKNNETVNDINCIFIPKSRTISITQDYFNTGEKIVLDSYKYEYIKYEGRVSISLDLIPEDEFYEDDNVKVIPIIVYTEKYIYIRRATGSEYYTRDIISIPRIPELVTENNLQITD